MFPFFTIRDDHAVIEHQKPQRSIAAKESIMAKAKTFTVGPVVTPKGVISFPHLDKPEMEGEYASKKFVTTILMPKTSDLTKLSNACLEAAKGQWPELKITSLKQIKLPFRDGDEKQNMRGYPGSTYLKVKTSYKPSIKSCTKLENGAFADHETPIRGGNVCRLSVTALPWEQNLDKEVYEALKTSGAVVIKGTDETGKVKYWRPSVTFMLNSVQFIEAGASMGGGNTTGSDFDDGEFVAPAAVAKDDMFD